MLLEQVNRLKKLMNLQESDARSVIQSVLPQLAQAAQSVYDEWDQDEDGVDDMYGAGGICDDIASKMSDVLSSRGLQCTTHYNEYDTHTSVYVYSNESEPVWNVDIHPNHYETGYGYNWKKIPGVQFTPQMISVGQISWEDFFGEENPDGNMDGF